ncbi:MAG: chalcone isomerase family protein [Alphaproteobacteria bacterium GM202ARS2]|nr:chalcone isomerase family protein [Alphaproteobacteria bacterium GM202ARS2]
MTHNTEQSREVLVAMSLRCYQAIGFALFVLMAPHTAVGEANRDNLAVYMSNPQPVGSGRLTYVFWDVYDIVLYASNGTFKSGEPYALSLSYLRELSGEELAERSVEEIEEQGFTDKKRLAAWQRQMTAIFPDVDEGITLTGVRDQNGNAIFYSNGKRIGTIKDRRFTRWFFGIWLSKKSTLPELRNQLLGRAE